MIYVHALTTLNLLVKVRSSPPYLQSIFKSVLLKGNFLHHVEIGFRHEAIKSLWNQWLKMDGNNNEMQRSMARNEDEDNMDRSLARNDIDGHRSMSIVPYAYSREIVL